MPIVTLNDVLPKGREKGYAVGAYDFMSHTMMMGIMDAAEETKTPVILQFPDAPFLMAELDSLAPAMIAVAKNASIPVVVHLDHGGSFDAVKKCVAAGFSSVMLDASKEPFEENVRLTKEVVDYCAPLGIPVEAELGHVGLGSEYDLNSYQYTDPDQAVKFVEATGISALAVAIGNAHGQYKGDPVINFEVLKAIEERVSIPLVLHGGSGISDADFKRIIKHGVSKVNIFTELTQEAKARLSAIKPEEMNVFSATAAIRSGFKARTIAKIMLFETERIS